MRLLLILPVLLCIGCASGANLAMPKLPGPASDVDCIFTRHDSLTGKYVCTIEGEYIMESVGLF